MVRGPLIPGIEEFDVPPKGVPSWVWWVVGIVGFLIALTVLGGIFGGVGPLRTLGLTTQELSPVAYRPLANERAIQVAVALPPQGLCRGENIEVQAIEQSNRIEVSTFVTRPRNVNCAGAGVAGDRAWVDVTLRFDLGERSVIRSSDRTPLQRTNS